MTDERLLKDGIPYRIEKSEKSMPFWEGLNEKKLRSTKCSGCKITHFPPSPILCTNCFGTSIEWIDIPLSGTIETYTHVDAPPGGFSKPYYLIAVKIDELNKSILGRYINENPEIGERVNIEFEDVDGQYLLVFAKS